LSERIKTEVEKYFVKFDSYEKIIDHRKQIEPKDFRPDNKYEFLIFAAIKTRNSALLTKYVDKKLFRPTMRITKAEFLKAEKREIDEVEFLQEIRELGKSSRFADIEEILKGLQEK
jgi:hypothetical protein